MQFDSAPSPDEIDEHTFTELWEYKVPDSIDGVLHSEPFPRYRAVRLKETMWETAKMAWGRWSTTQHRKYDIVGFAGIEAKDLPAAIIELASIKAKGNYDAAPSEISKMDNNRQLWRKVNVERPIPLWIAAVYADGKVVSQPCSSKLAAQDYITNQETMCKEQGAVDVRSVLTEVALNVKRTNGD